MQTQPLQNCPRCNVPLKPEQRFCGYCALPLDPVSIQQYTAQLPAAAMPAPVVPQPNQTLIANPVYPAPMIPTYMVTTAPQRQTCLPIALIGGGILVLLLIVVAVVAIVALQRPSAVVPPTRDPNQLAVDSIAPPTMSFQSTPATLFTLAEIDFTMHFANHLQRAVSSFRGTLHLEDAFKKEIDSYEVTVNRSIEAEGALDYPIKLTVETATDKKVYDAVTSDKWNYEWDLESVIYTDGPEEDVK